MNHDLPGNHPDLEDQVAWAKVAMGRHRHHRRYHDDFLEFWTFWTAVKLCRDDLETAREAIQQEEES